MTLPASPPITLAGIGNEWGDPRPTELSTALSWVKPSQRPATNSIAAYTNKLKYQRTIDGNCNNGNCTNNCNCQCTYQCVNCTIDGTVNCANCDTQEWLQDCGGNCNCACTYNCSTTANVLYDCDCFQCQCGDCGCCCFVAGTLVKTPSGLLPIEAIKIGDYVLDGSGQPTHVTGLITPSLDDRPLYIIDGHGVTSDHLFKTPDGWACAEVDRYTATRWNKVIDVNGRMVNIGSVHPDIIAPLTVGTEIVTQDGVKKIEQCDLVPNPEAKQIVYSLVTKTGDYLLESGHVVDGIPQ